MTTILCDTHVWVWATWESHRLSGAASAALVDADRILLSPVSLYEVGQKERLGKLPVFSADLERLAEIMEEQFVEAAPLTAAIAFAASRYDWSNRDPFDRIIAATASELDIPLLTTDRAFTAPGAPPLRIVW